jgi:ATP/maltotriose-dependent transcriptional regulator MalT
LEKAKRLAASHQVPPPRVAQIMACEQEIEVAPGGRSDQGLLNPLSARELEILGLFAAGLSNKEVADKLIISLGTVKAHSSNIYRKLDVRNRAQAIIRAGELNLL